MSVRVSWTIACDGWGDPGSDRCEWSCSASNDGDGFYPDGANWHTVEYGRNEDEGVYYCPACATRRGLNDEQKRQA